MALIDLVVIADDFTGSLDTGVQFSKVGAKVLATTTGQLPGIDTSGVHVLVINTESRHLSARNAGEAVRNAVTAAKRLKVRHFYKKTDSTLRGNIGAELDAFLAATERRAVVFVPAFPQVGRTTVGGHQLVDGIPLQETEFAWDPMDPVHTSHVPSLIASQTKVPVLLKWKKWKLTGRPSIIVFDAKTDEDLARIGSYVRRDITSLAFAGCAGFATVMASLIHSSYWQPIKPILSRDGGTLIICGSINPVSMAQVRHAEKAGLPTISVLSTPAFAVSNQIAENQRVYERVLDAIKARKVAILYTSLAENCAPTPAGSLSFVAQLGEIVQRTIDEARVDALVVFGGDTLKAVLDSILVSGVEPVDEITPGVAVSLPVYHDRKHPKSNMVIVSKAGGFGVDNFVFDVLAYIERMRVGQ